METGTAAPRLLPSTSLRSFSQWGVDERGGKEDETKTTSHCPVSSSGCSNGSSPVGKICQFAPTLILFFFQEKSDSTSSSFHEPFLDTSDPAVMEIEEVPAHKEYKNVATRRKPSGEVPEDGERPGSKVPASTTTPEQITDYKPQVSDGNPLGYVAANIYQTQPPAPLAEPETNVFFRDYTSPVPHLWDGEGGGHPVCLLEKINLILNNSRSGQSHAFGSAPGGPGSLPENQWGHALASDGQEQTLVPDELVSCLRAMNGESGDMKTCFPQSVGRLF